MNNYTTATPSTPHQEGKSVDTITTKYGTRVYFKGLVTGHPVVFSHGWAMRLDLFAINFYRRALKSYSNARTSGPASATLWKPRVSRKGSVTNHFASKEAFCLELLNRYCAIVEEKTRLTLRNDSA